jgi:hypothetical protein
LPPDYALALLDIAMEMTDLPMNKQLAARIRKLNGQPAPGQEDSPQAQAAQQEQDQQKAAEQASAQAAVDAKTRLTDAQAQAARAKARLDDTKAQHQAVIGKSEAMDAAGKVATAPALAPAADRIWNPAQAFPMPPEQFTTAT